MGVGQAPQLRSLALRPPVRQGLPFPAYPPVSVAFVAVSRCAYFTPCLIASRECDTNLTGAVAIVESSPPPRPPSLAWEQCRRYAGAMRASCGDNDACKCQKLVSLAPLTRPAMSDLLMPAPLT